MRLAPYALMGNTKLDAPEEEKDSYFEFKKDRTFVTTMGGTKGSYTGTWKYDASEKIIKFLNNPFHAGRYFWKDQAAYPCR